MTATDTTTNPSNSGELASVLQSEKGTDSSAVIEVAQASATPALLDPNELHSVVIPRGGGLKVIDLESKLDNPRRKRGTFVFWDPDSLSQFVNVHKGDGTALMIDDRRLVLSAVINGDSTSTPGWSDFVADLEFRRTDAWNRWLKYDDAFLDQEMFAEHIERNLVDITKPVGADMLELAQTFQATNSAEFRSQRRLANGQRQFTYTENIAGTGGTNGQIEIPETITLQIAPFEGSEERVVAARFRFRLNAGTLKLGYVLDNPQDVERQAIADVAKQVEQSTAVPVWFGAVRATQNEQ